jgi:hypothetical protein
VAATQYYVYSVDTSSGTQLEIETSATWNGPGVKVGGPFATKTQAQSWISGNPNALEKTVLSQDQSDVGYWIVVPEGEVGDIVNALSLATKNPLGDLVGELNGDLNTGSATTYTVTQLTTATQVQNAETANLTLYQTKAEAQAAADQVNESNNPSQGTSWEQVLEDLGSANLWIRVGKILIGGLLIIVAVSKMTGVSNAVTEVAGKVPVIP